MVRPVVMKIGDLRRTGDREGDHRITSRGSPASLESARKRMTGELIAKGGRSVMEFNPGETKRVIEALAAIGERLRGFLSQAAAAKVKKAFRVMLMGKNPDLRMGIVMNLLDAAGFRLAVVPKGVIVDCEVVGAPLIGHDWGHRYWTGEARSVLGGDPHTPMLWSDLDETENVDGKAKGESGRSPGEAGGAAGPRGGGRGVRIGDPGGGAEREGAGFLHRKDDGGARRSDAGGDHEQAGGAGRGVSGPDRADEQRDRKVDRGEPAGAGGGDAIAGRAERAFGTILGGK